MLNSFIIASCCAVLTTYFSALTAYGIHIYDFKLKKPAFLFIMAVMMIPPQVSAVGFIQLMYKFKLTNNFLQLIVPSIAAPIVFFYMKQYMESTLPHAIVEAARIDGADEVRTFNTISLPMMKPAIAVQTIFTFVFNWNNYFTPALILHDDKKFHELNLAKDMKEDIRSAEQDTKGKLQGEN
jgi:multiple sugar transport system permease protein